jgi:hypothetical protein
MGPTTSPLPANHKDIQSSNWIKIAFGLLIAALCAGMVFAVRRLLADNTLGIDLFVFWNSGRALFLEGSNPYDPEINRQVQMAIFGRAALPGEDPMLFAFPPYGLLAVLPLLVLPFDWAQAIWFVFYLMLAASLLYLLFPRAPRWVTLTLLLFYPLTFALILGNFVFLIGMILMLACGLLVLRRERTSGWQVVIGIMLAWVTIKPQFSWLYLAFLAAYALRYRLWTLTGSFILSLAAMLGLSWLVLPGWLPQWLQQVRAYAEGNQVQSIAASYFDLIMPTAQAGPAAAVLMILFLGVTIWMGWLWWRGKLGHLHLLAWVGLVTNLFDPRAISYEQITLAVPFFLWAATREKTSLALRIAWPAAIVLLWVFFVIAVRGLYPMATEQMPIAIFTLWLIWYYLHSRRASAGREVWDV